MARNELFDQVNSKEICIMQERDNCFQNNNIIHPLPSYKNNHKIIVYLKTNQEQDNDNDRAIENNYYNSNKVLKQTSSDKRTNEIKLNHHIDNNTTDCDYLHSNDEIIKERLKFVGEQLVQFIKLEPINMNSMKQRQTNNYDNNHYHHLKLKTIWNIYLKLLRAGPLDLYWNYKQDTCSDKNDMKMKLIVSRQQVLSFIENLNGYCDSINMLRLILKSSTMIAVIEAYEDIVSEIEDQRLANAKLYKLDNHNKWSNLSKEWSV